ncbi:TapY2 family type IVa secretion system protein [Thalassotalea aquiviva]|uniref:TapY2 family type IVa secretion system protein n=1 Tax=Thalassotalea aquiviva TaxID=3242415 RepID=UPI00352BB86F
MKKSLTWLSLTLFPFTMVAQPLPDRNEQFVDTKCFVEVFGGNRTIAMANVKRKNISLLTHMLVGRKIETQLSPRSREVYKVFECVEKTKKFSSRQARELDKALPR